MGGRFLTIALLCLLGMGLGTAYTWVNAQNDQAGSLASLEPAAGVAGGADIGGSFTLTDQNGNTLSSSDIDKYKLVFFGFTYCPDICPTTLAQLKLFYQELDPEVQADTQIWLVSVDPARDTPEQLDSYLEFFHPAFRGMTGDFLEIHRFATALNIPFAKVPGGGDEYMVDHSANVALVNPEGHSVGFFKAPLDISKMQRNFLTIREHYY